MSEGSDPKTLTTGETRILLRSALRQEELGSTIEAGASWKPVELEDAAREG